MPACFSVVDETDLADGVLHLRRRISQDVAKQATGATIKSVTIRTTEESDQIDGTGTGIESDASSLVVIFGSPGNSLAKSTSGFTEVASNCVSLSETLAFQA